jgi:hypothetical protein
VASGFVKHRFRTLGPLTIALLIASGTPRAAAAQTDEGRVDVAGGYAWLRDYDGGLTFPRGWFASVGAGLAGPLGVVGDASGSHESQVGLDIKFSMSILGLVAGPRIAVPIRRVTPFAQILFGLTRFKTTFAMPEETISDTANHFATQFGGGVDIHVTRHLSSRVGVHRRLVRSETFTETGSQPFTYREFQWFAGLVLR